MSDKNKTPVKLRGVLGGKFGTATRYLDVASPAEAIQALCCVVPGFEEFSRNLMVRIILKDGPVALDDIGRKTGRQEIRIVPVVRGAKSGAFEFLLGAVITTVGVLLSETPFGAPLIGMGISMMIGGIAQMLVRPPSGLSQTKNSFLFDNASNTIAQGIPVPVLYGEMTIVPPLISMGVDTEAYTDTVLCTAGTLYDGLGNWVGDGDTTPWGASLVAQ